MGTADASTDCSARPPKAIAATRAVFENLNMNTSKDYQSSTKLERT
jgi:hypothetical protein